ncbi:MAG: hypothetical protein EA379_05220 [Phycisphaerales bacterium]|nr:MAG: hypothetical protein EA379_05220 [Phycisphaerales bacterium]
MRRQTTILVGCVLASSLVLTGCGRSDDAPGDAANGPRTGDAGSLTERAQYNDVARDAQRAVDDARATMSAEIERYKAAMSEQMTRLDEHIRALDTRARDLEGAARTEMQNAVAELRQSREDFMKRMEELAAEGSAAWSDAQRSLDAAWSDLRRTADDAMERFNLTTPNAAP